MHRGRKVDSIYSLEEDLDASRVLSIGVAAQQKLRVADRVAPHLKPSTALVEIDGARRHPSRLPGRRSHASASAGAERRAPSGRMGGPAGWCRSGFRPSEACRTVMVRSRLGGPEGGHSPKWRCGSAPESQVMSSTGWGTGRDTERGSADPPRERQSSRALRHSLIRPTVSASSSAPCSIHPITSPSYSTAITHSFDLVSPANSLSSRSAASSAVRSSSTDVSGPGRGN